MRRNSFPGIAGPTFRVILTLIAFQAMTLNALAGRFDCSRQAVYTPIKILTERQLLKQEHSGREIYCYLKTKEMKEADKWLGPFRTQWETRFEQLDAVLKKIKTKKS